MSLDPAQLRKGLGDIAVRCFRDVADQDYIAARMAYRARLYPQFFWSSEQALEKYLKFILLTNRVVATQVRHDLVRALNLAEAALPYKFELDQMSRRFIDRIDKIGRFRYLEVSWHISGVDLLELDFVIWQLRRYCQIFRSPEDVQSKIDQSNVGSPVHFRLMGGELERILDRKDHPARPALVWKNVRFGQRGRKKISWIRRSAATNSPFWLFPQVVDEACKYIYLPKDVANAYREHGRISKQEA